MRSILWVLIGMGFMGTCNLVQGQVTYSYTGSTFENADPPYTTADSLSGSFSLPLPLAANLSAQDLSSLLVEFSFFDGVQNRTADNSAICTFSVSTDASGQITDWQISLRELPLPTTGDPQAFIDTSSSGDQAGTGPAGISACDTFSPIVIAGTSQQGSWVAGGPVQNSKRYDYEGEPFATAPAPYVQTDRVVGSLTLTGDLPALLSTNLDLSLFVIGFTFTDGVQTRNESNSALCSVRLGTGTAGEIVLWQVSLRELPLPAAGDPQRFVDITSNGDQVGQGPAGVENCSPFIPGLIANNAAPGDWSNDPPTPTATQYRYRGLPLTDIDPPYDSTDRITGSITIAGRLPAALPLTDVSLLLLDMTYEDGVQIRTLSNSFLCRFFVATNGQGEIVDWQVSLRAPLPAPGQPQAFLDSTPVLDQVGEVPAGLSACDNAIPVLISSNAGGGQWIGQLVRMVPVDSPMGLLLLAMMLVCVGLGRLMHVSE